MIRRILAVAHASLRETIRNRILSALVAFTVVMWGISYVMSRWSIGEPEKIMTDLGLTITTLSGVIIAIFSGITLIWIEVDRGTILTVLAKPISRGEYLIGKFLGFSFAVQSVYLGMCLVLMFFLWAMNRPPSLPLVVAMIWAMGEIEILIILAVFFSALTTPTLSAVFMILLFVSGRLSGDLKTFLDTQEPSFSTYLLKGVYYILPHLSAFNLRPYATYNLPVDGALLLNSALYGMFYCLLLLFLSWKVFVRRDLA